MAIIKEISKDEDESEVLNKEDYFSRNVQLERAKYEPTAKEKILSVMKAMVLRALVVFFLFWVFRRKTEIAPEGKSEL